MSIAIGDIIRHLRYIKINPKTIEQGNVRARDFNINSISYFLEIVNCGNVPDETVISNFKRSYDASERDNILTYYVESLTDAIGLCKQFYEKVGVPFTQEIEKGLKARNKENDRLLLFIVERPVYIG